MSASWVNKINVLNEQECAKADRALEGVILPLKIYDALKKIQKY